MKSLGQIIFASLLLISMAFIFSDNPQKKDNNIKISNETKNNIIKEENKQEENFYIVDRVIDGDTIVLRLDNKKEKIRLIGIDTPELNDNRARVSCFANEAKKAVEKLLKDHKVKLEADNSQADRDKYGRLLRYVFLDNGLFLNKWLIENGYAYEYTYNVAYKYQKEFKDAEILAKEQGKGLWGNELCKIIKNNSNNIVNVNLSK